MNSLIQKINGPNDDTLTRLEKTITELEKTVAEISKPKGKRKKAMNEKETPKVYIFDKEATAEAFKMTAHYCGFEATRLGSALLLHPTTYNSVLEQTYAPPAAIVATEDKE